ncbi:MAG: hypothetical protein OHK0017_07230 [Patescibacteria group bacterium]
MAWYNKYRPQTFQDTIGQELVKKVLQNTIKTIFTDTPRVKHAYLFSGPRGTGKTSLARIFSRALNCENIEFLKENAEPCGKCNTCLNGQIDIIELDAASNTGIDNVRELIEAANTPPFISRYKIYIIDEVHMLSKPAMNALLKTLEEPPSYVIFLMATTDPEKIIPTVMSRVTELRLTNHSGENLVGVINSISTKESLSIDPNAAELIAKQARGGLRDAINLLETLANYNLDKYDEKVVSEILGVMPDEKLKVLVESLLSNNSTDLQAQVKEFESRGVDPQVLLAQLLDYLVNTAFREYQAHGKVDALYRLAPLIQATEKILTASFALTSTQTALILLKIELGNQSGNSATSSGVNHTGPSDSSQPNKPAKSDSSIDSQLKSTPPSHSSSNTIATSNSDTKSKQDQQPVLNTIDPGMFDDMVSIPLISDVEQSIIKDSTLIEATDTISSKNTIPRSLFTSSNFVALIHANLDIKHGPVILKTFWDNLVSYESEQDEILIHILNKTFLPPLKSSKTVTWLNQLAKDCYGKDKKVIITDSLEGYNIHEITLPIQIKVKTETEENNSISQTPNFSLGQGNGLENSTKNVNLEITSSVSIQTSKPVEINSPTSSEFSNMGGQTQQIPVKKEEEEEFKVSDFYFLYSPLPDGTVPNGMKLYAEKAGVSGSNTQTSNQANSDFDRWKSELDDLELE